MFPIEAEESLDSVFTNKTPDSRDFNQWKGGVDRICAKEFAMNRNFDDGDEQQQQQNNNHNQQQQQQLLLLLQLQQQQQGWIDVCQYGRNGEI